jgi:predicted RNase H-like HicB family nuclease
LNRWFGIVTLRTIDVLDASENFWEAVIHDEARHGDDCRTSGTGFASKNIKQYLAAGRTQMTMRYTIIEHGPENFSAYAPDFPGCVAAADTEKETLALMKEALEMHIEDMRERGEPIPQPSAIREVKVAA